MPFWKKVSQAQKVERFSNLGWGGKTSGNTTCFYNVNRNFCWLYSIKVLVFCIGPIWMKKSLWARLIDIKYQYLYWYLSCNVVNKGKLKNRLSFCYYRLSVKESEVESRWSQDNDISCSLPTLPLRTAATSHLYQDPPIQRSQQSHPPCPDCRAHTGWLSTQPARLKKNKKNPNTNHLMSWPWAVMLHLRICKSEGRDHCGGGLGLKERKPTCSSEVSSALENTPGGKK